MGLFFRRDDKKSEGSGGGRSFAKSYDKEKTKPAIRCSICTGEQVAGFLNKRSITNTNNKYFPNPGMKKRLRRKNVFSSKPL